ncbi:class I SAM-dependent methyltransferase [Micromonospora sp. NPDC048898]|uniref:class I SAM-dependent methyltransferase n=1 Tax=Micromonospora sp. NPDC048898 TaxID=3364260 RepID=UPI0037227737
MAQWLPSSAIDCLLQAAPERSPGGAIPTPGGEFMNDQVWHDLLALQVLAPLSSSYLPWNVAAMRPSGVVAVLNEVVINRRRHIVELGSGISSVYLGRLARQRGGQVWTVEHDEQWADTIEQQLADESLDDVVTVVRAPLAPTASAWPHEENAWYETDAIRRGIADQPIDLLIIDGPPASDVARQHSRYPAIPFFASLLADDYAIILDDIDRPGEQEIMKRWEQDLDISFERQILAGGIGIGRSRPSFTV